ncbi:Uncharacterized protein DAT39_018407, partial [Clarias magur]
SCWDYKPLQEILQINGPGCCVWMENGNTEFFAMDQEGLTPTHLTDLTFTEMMVVQQQLEEVTRFTYLGNILASDGDVRIVGLQRQGWSSSGSVQF